jgi:hypothetical protein
MTGVRNALSMNLDRVNETSRYERRLLALIVELEATADELDNRANLAGAAQALRAELHRKNASRLRAVADRLRKELSPPVAAPALARSQ